MVFVCSITPGLEAAEQLSVWSVLLPARTMDFLDKDHNQAWSPQASPLALFSLQKVSVPHMSMPFLKSKNLANSLGSLLAFQRRNALPIHIDTPAI